MNLDSLCSDIRAFSVACCSQRVQRPVVCLCLPVLDPLFVDHPNQVSSLTRVVSRLDAYAVDASLRVNLDMGKTVYAQQIMNDSEIPNTIVRTSTLPEELGRIEYLLSDKTGTLTQNGTYIELFA